MHVFTCFTPRRCAFVALALAFGCPTSVLRAATADTCPPPGWAESLSRFLDAGTPISTSTTPAGAQDCQFQEWSWEAFVWATALDTNGVPRFLSLPVPDDLLNKEASAGKAHARGLKLAARSVQTSDMPGYIEGAGAFVEADGNVLVSHNGYPVYASIHMNESYFATAQKNLVVTGDYSNNASADTHFAVGAAVFKAAWLRLDPNEAAPAGSYVTQAQVPVLTTQVTGNQTTILPVPGKFVTVTVALVGLHVVGYTDNHPEFVWGTFEHRLNSPALKDGRYADTHSEPNNFTFYTANTPFSAANAAAIPAALKLDAKTQRLSPITQVVLLNRTGGDNQTGGPDNIAAVNKASQAFLRGQKAAQAVFANYNLIGSVWMADNTYTKESLPKDAVGALNLSNTTAETFLQVKPQGANLNCFACHNPRAYTFPKTQKPLAYRRIALSHVLGIGTPYAVPNLITGGTVGGATSPSAEMVQPDATK